MTFFQPIGEMNEANLLVASEIFWPTGDWLTQKDFITMKQIKENFIKLMPQENHYNDVSEHKSYFLENGLTFYACRKIYF